MNERQPTTRSYRCRATSALCPALSAVVVGALVAVLLAFGSAGQVAVQGVGDAVSDARAELDASEAAQAEIEEIFAQTRDRYAALKQQLDQLSAQNRTTLNQIETVQSRAERLAVAAYVRGAGAEDLQTLDVQRATDAAWRRVFTEGRVDQALEAAARLKTLRAETDEGMQALAREVTAVGRLIDGVGEDRRRAAGRVAAALSASADAEAAAQREAQARRAAEAAASATAPPRAPTTPGSRPEAPPSPPPSFPKPSVGLAEAWAELRDCEAGGDYTAVSPDGQYRGVYQFDRSTWASVGGHGDPAAAPPAEQDYRAQLLYDLVGKGAWPYCGRLLP